MALIACRECGARVWQDAAACPQCGFTGLDVQSVGDRARRIARSAAIKLGLIALGVAGMAFFTYQSDRNSLPERPRSAVESASHASLDSRDVIKAVEEARLAIPDGRAELSVKEAVAALARDPKFEVIGWTVNQDSDQPVATLDFSSAGQKMQAKWEYDAADHTVKYFNGEARALTALATARVGAAKRDDAAIRDDVPSRDAASSRADATVKDAAAIQATTAAAKPPEPPQRVADPVQPAAAPSNLTNIPPPRAAALNTCERFKALPVLQQWRRWEAMKYYSVANPAQLPEPNPARMPPSCAAFAALPGQDQANRLIEALSKERPGHYSFSVAENGIEDLASREHYNANNLLCQYLNGEINRAQFDERVLVAIGEDTRNNPMAEGEVQDVFFPSTATINSIGTDPSSEVERICAFGMGELSRSDFDKQMATLKAQRLIQVVSEPKAQPPAATQAIENPSRIAPSHHHRRRRSATSAAKS